jgi:multisubunit Na+/H+ antiporter MnhG subunit
MGKLETLATIIHSIGYFTWFYNFNNQTVTSSNFIIFIYLIKNKHKNNINLYKF